MTKPEKTHVVVPEAEITVRYLADYMAASERRRRSIIEGCKYRPLARLLQHKEAQITISSAIQSGTADPKALETKADYIRNKLATDDFDALTNEANADYLERFSEVVASIKLPNAEILPGKKFPAVKVHGVKVKLKPHLLLARIDKKNVQRTGAFMLRYAKGKPLDPNVGGYQSAAVFGLLKNHLKEEGAEADRSICVTLDAFSGELYPAPGNSVTIFENMKAACQTISERWPNIPPPKGAII
ncbi:hypothetical protein [Bradyrhizobium yuanmingense]|uniref:hypothetical protein n=1 Tax=Bradyrhizobium yuanmingense TaxID=108015 RepID=UPI001CD5F146|nr:hypothetical protein [Bradyrhizobium yuanmingense]MCA1527358.1 hypothetical protein [Bradyrhizobium yuanmingense]